MQRYKPITIDHDLPAMAKDPEGGWLVARDVEKRIKALEKVFAAAVLVNNMYTEAQRTKVEQYGDDELSELNVVMLEYNKELGE